MAVFRLVLAMRPGAPTPDDSAVSAPEITVLIPTRAVAARASSLRQALESALCQQEVAARAILLLNGASNEPDLPRALLDDPRVSLLRRATADLPAALQEGVRAVETPWFATLDDDDALLPSALKLRLAALARHAGALVAVSNGYRRHSGENTLHVVGGHDIRRDPLRALLRRNWLLPGSWLCRTTPATRALFDAMPRHLECTYLAVRFAELGMVWIDEPTMIYNVGSPFSASQSRAYVQGQAAALRHILTLPLPTYARREFRARIAASHHRLANVALASGDVTEAWRWHLATLRERRGWRYLPFVRHLVRASLSRQR